MAETYLYQHLDAEKKVLYAGITSDLKTRSYQHGLQSPWRAQVCEISAAMFSTRAEAQAAEKEIIVAEKPPFNRHTPGEKSDFVKCTITLPPEVYKILSDEAARRKMAKEKNAQISAIIREAVVEKLCQQRGV